MTYFACKEERALYRIETTHLDAAEKGWLAYNAQPIKTCLSKLKVHLIVVLLTDKPKKMAQSVHNQNYASLFTYHSWLCSCFKGHLYYSKNYASIIIICQALS